MEYKIYQKDPLFKDSDMFRIGKRDGNAKRNFLFLSKWIGKHLECEPSFLTNVSLSLCEQVGYQSPDDHMCIGFAETATGLGMAIAENLHLPYISTTREDYKGEERINFKEEHSHAADHYIYDVDELREKKGFFLIDDEITTGRSLRNMIQILKKETNVTEYQILSILNWMPKEQMNQFIQDMKAEGICVFFHALVFGEITKTDDKIYHNTEEITKSYDHDFYMTCKKPILSPMTGRRYLHHYDFSCMETNAFDIALKLDHWLDQDKQDILILGHGENIFFPYRVAHFLDYFRKFVTFKTTSRTPICVDHEVIHSRIRFKDPKGVTYHIYNIEEMEQHDVVIFLSEAGDVSDIEVPRFTKNMMSVLCGRGGKRNERI